MTTSRTDEVMRLETYSEKGMRLAKELSVAWQHGDGPTKLAARRQALEAHFMDGEEALLAEYGPKRSAVQAMEDDAAKQGQEGWKPIESAPKDGSWILLGYFLEGGGGGSPEVAHWHDQRLMWCSSSKLLNSAGYYSPTHWMPLPAAPTGEPK